MNLMSLLSGSKSYIELVKEFIGKVFTHEEKKFELEPGDISIILHKAKSGEIQIMSYTNIENVVLRIIPDKEAEHILTK
jgi:hypothetical protein